MWIGGRVAGVEGAFNYKNNKKFPLYDQYEMDDICRNLGKADIIISHNSPLGIHDSFADGTEDIAHLSFAGLRDYIKKHCPKYLIHGYQHIDKLTNYIGTKGCWSIWSINFRYRYRGYRKNLLII